MTQLNELRCSAATSTQAPSMICASLIFEADLHYDLVKIIWTCDISQSISRIK